MSSPRPFREVPLVDFACGDIGSEEFSHALKGLAELRTYSRGDFIVHEGDEPRCLGIVISGRVKVFKTAANGREVILHLLRPKSLFGVIPVLDGGPYPASVVAMEDSEVGLISRHRFLHLLLERPEFALTLLQSFSRRLRGLTDSLVSSVASAVAARLAAKVLELAGTGRAVHITRQELADMVGTTVETAIRVTRAWEQAEIVRLSRGRIEVLSPCALKEIAGH